MASTNPKLVVIRLTEAERDLNCRALHCLADILDQQVTVGAAEFGLKLAALYTRDQLRALAAKFEPRSAATP